MRRPDDAGGLMKDYQKSFVDFLLSKGALKFGDFTLKSGRKSPYFVNMGSIDDGPSMRRLGVFYAGLLMDRFGGGFNALFGPAYKGIPLAAAAAIALDAEHATGVRVSFNRKEEKAHGEKGLIFGHLPAEGDRFVLVDDVFTTGETKDEALDLLLSTKGVSCAGVAIAVDRQEAVEGGSSAVQVFEARRGIPVGAIVTAREIVAYLGSTEGGNVIDGGLRGRMAEYLGKYGSEE